MTDSNATVETWQIFARVHGKDFKICCGDGSQKVKWVGHVAIARWDEENNQGWKRLGIPNKVIGGPRAEELDMGVSIRDVLRNGDSLTIHTTLDPYETR